MEILTTGASLAVVVGLVQLYKNVIGDSRFTPLVALVMGISIAFLTTPDFVIRTAIFQGMINGLSAAGLYSGAKTILRPQPAE